MSMEMEDSLKDKIEAAITHLLYLRVKYPEDFIVNDESYENAVICLDKAAKILNIEYLFNNKQMRDNFIIEDCFTEYNKIIENKE